MDLSQSQIETFQREGYLAIESVFSPAEVDALEAALPDITDPSRPQVGRDPDTGLIRLSHGAHLYNEAYRRLALHPKFVRPAERLLGTSVYAYQSRLTIKPGVGALQATGWPWHQDFSTWSLYDGMLAPTAVVAFIFLDDVTAANAPMLMIPRSHEHGMIGTAADAVPRYNGYQQILIKPETLRELAERAGVAAVTGPRGTVIYMHCNLVHGSGENISPLRRALYSVVYNAITNLPKHPRDPHWASADAVPIQPLADDCLLTMSPALVEAAGMNPHRAGAHDGREQP